MALAASAACAAELATLADTIANGRISLNLRLRYEGVAQTGLRDADALTLRTRLGFTTASRHGWKAMLEAENILAADGDSYSQAGLNAGGAGRAVVADPETTEINQAFLSYTGGQTTVTAGRQRLVLDNARFVGDVGWRQNAQTFDAVSVQNTSLGRTTLTYAYLEQINRVFGDRHAQGKWESDSHLFNASYAGGAAGTLTGYAYLLDFKKAAAAHSCATYGASFAGAAKLSDRLKLAYRAELAHQADYGTSASDYATTYYALEAGLAGKAGGLTLGREVLGSDRSVGFKTPLATLHAFNGWADLFLATPAAGLRDDYVKAAVGLPADLSLLAFEHWYETDVAGVRLGSEFNLQLSRKFGKSVTGLVKYADFRRDGPGYPNVQKIWAQVEFAR
ncbi:MAG: alginate export family protein [Opitutae bacterium]|nr:alginate export family protein [Opitutae bacterium]